MSASRQAHGELGELADFAVNGDRAAMLQGYDLVADRQAKSRALAGRLGREERLEQLLTVFPGNADAVVAHPNLDGITHFTSRDLQDRAIRAVAVVASLIGGIEAVAD